MNYQRALVCKILQTGRIREVITKYRITPFLFSDPLARQIFSEVYQHWRKYQEVPSPDLIVSKFPSFQYQEIRDSLEVLCDKVRGDLIRRDVTNLITNYEQLLSDDPQKFLTTLRNKLDKVYRTYQTSNYLDRSVTDLYDAVMDLYWQSKKSQGIIGLPYPWESLNKATGGLEPEQFVLIYANSAMMKTWALVYCLYFWSSMKQKCLFITREMSLEQITRRLLCFVAQVDSRRFRTGRLTPEEEQKLIQAKSQMEELNDYILISEVTDEDREFTLDAVRAKVEEVSPEIVLLDGMHLMSVKGVRERDWKNFMLVSQGMKQIAKDNKLCMVATSQANRKGSAASSTADDIGFSYDFYRDTDVVLRLLFSRSLKAIAVLIKKCREGESGGFVIRAEPGLPMEENRDFPKIDVHFWMEQIAKEAKVLDVPVSLELGDTEGGTEEEELDGLW